MQVIFYIIFRNMKIRAHLKKSFFEKICATQVLPTGVKSGEWYFFKWTQIINCFRLREDFRGQMSFGRRSVLEVHD